MFLHAEGLVIQICDTSLIILSEFTTEPEVSAETLLYIGSLREHIDALADNYVTVLLSIFLQHYTDTTGDISG